MQQLDWSMAMAANVGLAVISAALLGAWHRARAEARRAARVDPLTGAANAVAFRELAERELEKSRRYGRSFCLAYMDVDDFKEVNDRLGHARGDELLRLVVRTIAQAIRSCDTVARLGGDEFAVLLPETKEEAGQAVLEKLQDALALATKRVGQPVTFSIGLVACPVPPCALQELMRRADSLMYTVKRNGKNALFRAPAVDQSDPSRHEKDSSRAAGHAPAAP